MFSLSDYTFTLKDDSIAEFPASPAHNAKLMVIDRETWDIIGEDIFYNIDKILDKNKVLFFNNSKVLKARIVLNEAKFVTIENHEWTINWEIFFLKKINENKFEALVRPGKKFKIWTKIFLWNSVLKVDGSTETGRIISIENSTIDEILENFGNLPLPPYIEYSKEKEKDYQNFFASKNGSVAAPTASLHFTEELINKIPNEKIFLTLHIGLGTFKTINTDDIRSYNIHDEQAEINLDIFKKIFEYKNSNRPIVAVGTTACRTLESLPSLWKILDEKIKKNFHSDIIFFWDTISQNSPNNWISSFDLDEENIFFSTRAYIIPGYNFAITDELITNFHLPESSLLVLVSALIGQPKLLQNYNYAVEKNYKFFSFGDGMYIKKNFIF